MYDAGVNPDKVQAATETPEYQLGTIAEVRPDWSTPNPNAGTLTGSAKVPFRKRGGQFCFGKASAAIGVGYLVAVDVRTEGQAEITPVNTSNIATYAGCPIGVAQVAIADNGYGWVMLRGRGVLNVAAGTAADRTLTTSTNAGRMTATGGTQVHGVQLTTAATGAGTAPCIVFNPQI